MSASGTLLIVYELNKSLATILNLILLFCCLGNIVLYKLMLIFSCVNNYCTSRSAGNVLIYGSKENLTVLGED